MLTQQQTENLYNTIKKHIKVLRSVVCKADKADTTTIGYLAHSDERYCVVKQSGLLNGVDVYDKDYRKYNVYNSREEIDETKLGADEVVIPESAAIHALIEYDKQNTQSFYKWGYSFSLDMEGNLEIRGCNGGFFIHPEASNTITIIDKIK